MAQIICDCETVGRILPEKRGAVGNNCKCKVNGMTIADCRVALKEK